MIDNIIEISVFSIKISLKYWLSIGPETILLTIVDWQKNLRKIRKFAEISTKYRKFLIFRRKKRDWEHTLGTTDFLKKSAVDPGLSRFCPD